MPTILITGAAGQLGQELQRFAPAGYTLLPMTSSQLDITHAGEVADAVQQHRPDWIINAAAYTAVDKAETDRATAQAINAEGPAHLARAAQQIGARMVQVSTDYVFSGHKCMPYTADDPTDPVSWYGQTKLAGELAVRDMLPDAHLIIRTSWLYSGFGHNFVKTMLRLMAEREQMGVVVDQIGAPTYAAGLAKAIYAAIGKELRGTYGWSDLGVASWYDFAQAIQTLALEAGLLSKPIKVMPIPTSAYPTLATRPIISMLATAPLLEATGLQGQYWRDALKNMLEEIKNG